MSDDREPASEREQSFPNTHWSVVVHAGDPASPQRGKALETLCRAYWYPLYAYLRRRGFPEEEAKDQTQAAERLGLSETGARSVVHRLRKRFRELVREEIAHTVSRPEDIDDELRHLFQALS